MPDNLSQPSPVSKLQQILLSSESQPITFEVKTGFARTFRARDVTLPHLFANAFGVRVYQLSEFADKGSGVFEAEALFCFDVSGEKVDRAGRIVWTTPAG